MLKRHIFIPGMWIFVLVFWALPALAEMIVDTAWVRRYSGPSEGDHCAYAIAVDSSGNICVTGVSYGGETHDDYATIKYDPSGNQLWVQRYNGLGNYWDAAYAIVVDVSNNVYVTGPSTGSVTSRDYATVKYDSSGNQLWVKTYHGSGNSDDFAYGIAVDDSGNVYVTGWSAGYATGSDYATIKYYPSGDTAWVRRYEGSGNTDDDACAIALDSFGNIYVTGDSRSSGLGHDYVTVKYGPDGNELWVNSYNGYGNDKDEAKAIAGDYSGNVYVTGYSWGGYGTYNDYATIKYDSSGNELWVQRYNGPGDSADWASAIAVDSSGNVFVTGWSFGSGTDMDYATIKYYSIGDTAWVRRYNGPGSSKDEARAIAVDGSGSVYVTGWSGQSNTHPYNLDFATIKYDTSGNELWIRRYNGSENYSDGAYAIAVDASNNVYVTGFSSSSGTDRDYATIKYFQALRGDANRDWVIDIGDIVYLINYLYKGGPPPDPLEVGNCNCDEVVDLGDVVFLVNYLFKGGPPPDC